MLLKDVMTTQVRGVSVDESVQSTAQIMEQLRVGSVPVFRDGEPVGIVTDRDIVVRAVAAGRDCSQTPAGEVMSSGLITLAETTPIEEAVREMEERQIRRLLVSGGDNRIVGIVSLGDIVTKTGEHQLSAELIEMVSLPAEPAR